jgi:hypothetical protein
MGLFDTFEDAGNSEQVKCFFNEMKIFKMGDKLPSLQNYSSYAIKRRFPVKGLYFIIVLNYGFLGFSETSRNLPVFDKWGNLYSEKSKGLFGEDYILKREDASPTKVDADEKKDIADSVGEIMDFILRKFDSIESRLKTLEEAVLLNEKGEQLCPDTIKKLRGK